jgi:KRAB domain-containing zinc finger protein
MTQLKAHMFQHTGIKEHTCETCKMSFSRKVLLTEHIKYDHEGLKPFQCKYCEKTYKRKDDYIRHWKGHKGIKSYTCEICSKGFALKASLKLHHRTHLLSVPVDCLDCGKRFIRDDCLQRHRKQKHPESGEGVVFEIVTVGGDPSNPNDENIAVVQAGQAVNFPVVPAGESIGLDPEDDEEEEGEFDESGQITIKVPVVDEVLPRKPIKQEKKAPQVKTMANDETEEGEVMMSQIFTDAPIFMDDVTLKERIYDLLVMLVDEETLTELGWPDKEVTELLAAIILNCGHEPLSEYDDTVDESTRLRENTKLLFTLVIDNDHVKSLLNNYTVDEVIHYVLKIGKI